MLCKSCDCGCLILPYECLYEKDLRLNSIGLEKKPLILNSVNAFVLVGDGQEEGLIGHDCFQELCSEIKSAYAQAKEYKETNMDSTSEQAEFWYYLSDKWKAFLNNSYFQSMYAAYCMYYYYVLGMAHSESSKDGDVKHKRQGVDNSGEASENISYGDSKAMAATNLSVAKRFASLFKTHFLDKYYSNYDCLKKCKRYCKDERDDHKKDCKRKSIKVKARGV